MKNITEFIKESLINEMSAELLSRAAEKARSMQGAKYKRLAKEFEKWRDSHEREDQMVQQAVQQATKKNKPKPVTPTSKAALIDLIVSSLENDITDLNYIDTSKITDMSNLFACIYHNGNENEINKNIIDKIDSLFEKIDVSEWDVSNVTDMEFMFDLCRPFNCDISRWDVSNVTNMKRLFYGCRNFNCDLSLWDVSNVKDMTYAFTSCKTSPKWYKK